VYSLGVVLDAVATLELFIICPFDNNFLSDLHQCFLWLSGYSLKYLWRFKKLAGHLKITYFEKSIEFLPILTLLVT
tara:strand:+ start:805 stop:1032 length:228 start_codon:yes stop_codon:yes gene_type:complete